MCHGFVNPKFLVQWTHRLLLNVNSFWGLYVCFWYTSCESRHFVRLVCVCVRSLWIIRVFIVHVSIDCATVRISLEKWTLKLSELTNVKVDVYLCTYISWYPHFDLFRLFFDVKVEEFRIHSESYIVTVYLYISLYFHHILFMSYWQTGKKMHYTSVRKLIFWWII